MLKLADDGWFQWGREGDISIVWNDLWRNRTKGKDRQAGALTSDRPDGAKSEWSKKESIDNCRIRTCDPEGIRYLVWGDSETAQFESYALTTRPNCLIVESLHFCLLYIQPPLMCGIDGGIGSTLDNWDFLTYMILVGFAYREDDFSRLKASMSFFLALLSAVLPANISCTV